MVAERYIEPTPAGVVAALRGPARDPANRLLRGLLLRPPARAWSTPELQALLPGEGAAAGRALFALQREQQIQVRLQPPADDGLDWPGIGPDLQALVADGAQWAVLLDADGFVVAQAGELPPLAAAPGLPDVPPPADLVLHLGDGLLATRYGLAAGGLRLEDHPRLVSLARRLARLRVPR